MIVVMVILFISFLQIFSFLFIRCSRYWFGCPFGIRNLQSALIHGDINHIYLSTDIDLGLVFHSIAYPSHRYLCVPNYSMDQLFVWLGLGKLFICVCLGLTCWVVDGWYKVLMSISAAAQQFISNLNTNISVNEDQIMV